MPSETNNVTPQEDQVFLPHIKGAVTEFAHEMGYEDPRFEAAVASQPGDGYLSYMVRVKVTSNSKPNLNPLHLVVKTTPQSEKLREAYSLDTVFPNEMNMYSIILPTFAKYLQEKGVINEMHFPGTARCYKTSAGGKGTEIMVMEDLKAHGFEMAPERKKGLSKEHCKLVIGTLARLHSTTRAFEIEKPEEFKEIRDKVTNVWSREKIEEYVPLGMKSLKMIDKRFPEGTVERAKLRQLLDNYPNEIMLYQEPDPDGFNVVNHGDCWANNMMFKTDPTTGKPTEVVIYDFQNARFASPIVDIFYFIFLNTVPEVRGDLSEFLSFYVDEFNKHLSNLGCTTGHITLEMINQKVKKYGRTGVTMSAIALPIMLSESTDVPDLNATFEEADTLADALSWACARMDVVEERFCDVLEDSIRLGYL